MKKKEILELELNSDSRFSIYFCVTLGKTYDLVKASDASSVK